MVTRKGPKLRIRCALHYCEARGGSACEDFRAFCAKRTSLFRCKKHPGGMKGSMRKKSGRCRCYFPLAFLWEPVLQRLSFTSHLKDQRHLPVIKSHRFPAVQGATQHFYGIISRFQRWRSAPFRVQKKRKMSLFFPSVFTFGNQFFNDFLDLLKQPAASS